VDHDETAAVASPVASVTDDALLNDITVACNDVCDRTADKRVHAGDENTYFEFACPYARLLHVVPILLCRFEARQAAGAVVDPADEGIILGRVRDHVGYQQGARPFVVVGGAPDKAREGTENAIPI
jgi:hypothetical protein